MKSVRDDIEQKHKEFADEVRKLDAEALKARIVALQKGLQESEEHRENNEALHDAKETVRMLQEPYNDVRKAVKLKTKYILELLLEHEV